MNIAEPAIIASKLILFTWVKVFFSKKRKKIQKGVDLFYFLPTK